MSYKDAGVDILLGNEAVKRIKPMVERTFSKEVATKIGAFGALYDLKRVLNDYQHPLLVQSIDGVGTKTIVAKMMQKFDTLGIDLVSATANDIVVMGATPLTLLDYIAADKLKPVIIESIVKGMAESCFEHGISLIGGETAEMPGTYCTGEHDLAGVITGVVEKDKVILGQNITHGDVVFGLSSSGLHTNGYSLARKIFFERAQLEVDSYLQELQCSLGEALLEPHINYTKPILHCLHQGIAIKGMAHITGGGFIENIPRILPSHLSVEIHKNSWLIPPIFSMMQHLGQLQSQELFTTFNMGIGLVIIADESESDKLQSACAEFKQTKLYQIGRVIESSSKTVEFI